MAITRRASPLPCPMAQLTLGCLCSKVFLLVMSMMMMTVVVMVVTKMRTVTTPARARLLKTPSMDFPLLQPRFQLARLVHRSRRIRSNPHRPTPTTRAKMGTVRRFTTTIATRACLSRQRCPRHRPTHWWSSHPQSPQSSRHPFAILKSRSPCQHHL
jgi:hypothetical protein